MKIQSILLSIIFSILMICQLLTAKINFPRDLTTNKITFQKVVVLDSTYSKEILYSNARKWIAKTIDDSKQPPYDGIDFEYIQMNDTIFEKITGKGSIPISVNMGSTTQDAGYVHFRMSIFVEDGKYKYIITNLYHTGIGEYFTSNGFLEKDDTKNSNMSIGCWDNLKNNTLKRINSLIQNFKDSMKTKNKPVW